MKSTCYSEFVASLPGHITTSTEENGRLRVNIGTPEDLQAVVGAANITQTPLVPCGGWGGIPPETVGLDMRTMNRVNSYRSEEFLIQAEVGMSVGQLSETLDAQNQRMAHLYSLNRSLLSILGEETLSLRSTKNGALRDWVVGLEAVTGDGEWIHYGGEVVKNVTGYDMSKLFIGSRHRYGLITRVILKVEPRPEQTRSFLFHIEELDQAMALVQRLMQLLPHPEVLALFRTKTTFGWQVLLTLGGSREAVHRDSETVHEAVTHLQSDLQELYLAPSALQQWVQKLDWQHPDEPDALVIRVALAQKQMLDLPFRLMGQPWLKSADVLMPLKTSTMLMRWISVNIPQEEDLLALKAAVKELGGFVRILRVPPGLHLNVAGFNADPQPVVAQWEQRLKSQFDPRGVLAGDGLSFLTQEAVR